VLLFHANHLKGGYLGVDFFFVLSGYLITSLLLAEAAQTGSVGLGGFWARRARRLLPALAVLLVGVAAYCVVYASRSELGQIRGDAFATLGYVANWREVFSHQDYFALFSSPSPLNHTWSLAIEEQFYLVWPLVFFGLLTRFRVRTPRAVLVTALVLAAVSTLLMFELYSPASTTRAYFGTDTRAAAILFGAALAAWNVMRPPTGHRGRRVALEVVGVAGVVVLAVAWVALDGQSRTLYRGGFLVCGVAATAVIAAVVHPQRGVLARLLEFRPLVGLGLISYGVYLYHWPIDIVLDAQRVHLGGWPLVLVQVAVTLVVSIASFKLVERPVRTGAIRAPQWRRLTPAIAFALVLAIFTTTTGAKSLPSVVRSLGKHPIAAARLAYRGAVPGSKRIMIVGDSVGYFLGRSFQRVAPDYRSSVLNAGLQGCVLLSGVSEARYDRADGSTAVLKTYPCDPPWERAAVKAFRPDIVLWIVSNPATEYLDKGRQLRACSPEFGERYRAQLASTAAELQSSGAQVFMTTEVYPRYLLADADAITDCDNQLRRAAIPATGVTLIDLQARVCPDGHCIVKEHGVTLRTDGEHYRDRGGDLIAEWLLGQMHVPRVPR
jgi:peptidoglycan/LPS O-acetylase OafA/YrhL